MYGLCHFGNLGYLGSSGLAGLIGLLLNLAFGFGLILALALVVFLAARRARASAVAAPQANGQPTTKENLQAQYARGEITREQYERRKQDVG